MSGAAGGAGARQIRFQIAVDEVSARKAKALVDDLTRSVERLVQTASRAGSALQGLGGGGGVNVTARRTPGPGQGGIGHMAAANAKGGVVANILGGDASAVRNLVTSSQQAFSSVSAAIKTFVDRAESDVQRLTRAVAQLQRGLGGGVGSVSFGGPSSYAPGRGPSGTLLGMPGLPQALPGPGGAPLPLPGGGGGRGAGGGPKGPGFFGGIWGGAQQVGGMAGLGGVSGALGMLSRFGVVGGAVAAGAAGYEYLAGASQEGRVANLRYTVNEPLERLNRRAAVAAPFQQIYGRTRHGDVAYGMAVQQTLRDTNVMSSLRFSHNQREELALRLSGIEDPTLRSVGKRLRSALSQNTIAEDMSYGGVMALLPGMAPDRLDSTSRKTLREISEEIALRGMSPEQAQQFQQAVTAREALMDPRLAANANRLYHSAMGNVGMARHGFLSTGMTRDAEGNVIGHAMTDLEASLTAQGYGVGEYAGARRQLVSTAGKGYLGRIGATRLLNMQYGGLQGADSLLRAGGILSGGVGGGLGFLNAVQGSIGRGGLDVTAGSELFSALTSRMLGTGQYQGNSAEAFARMAAAVVGGGAGAPMDVAEQMRRAAMFEGGLTNFGSLTSGAKAPLYQATSMFGAMGAMGGYGGGAEALMRMDPGLAMAIARGADIPDWAKGQGVTQEAAQKFLRYQRRAPLFEVVDDLYAGTETGALLGEVRKAEAGGGSFMDAFAARTKGLKGRARAHEEQRLAELLGGALYTQGLAASPEAGAGTFLSQFSQAEGYGAGTLRGRGAGAAGPAGPEAAALQTEASQLRADSKIIAANIAKLTTAIAALPALSAGGQAGVAAAAGGPDSIQGAQAAFVTAVREMTRAMSEATRQLSGMRKVR